MRTSCSLVRRSDESCAYFALQRRISSTLAGNENTLVWGRPLTLPEHQLPTGTTIELATAAPHIEACRARIPVSTPEIHVARRSPLGSPICPGCRKTMVFKDKEHILFSNGLTDVTYRCESCGTETKRTVKDL